MLGSPVSGHGHREHGMGVWVRQGPHAAEISGIGLTYLVLWLVNGRRFTDA